MQDFAAVLGNAMTGLFALLGAFLAWRLRRKDDEADRRTARIQAKRNDLVDLYASVIATLEQAIRCSVEREQFELTTERSLVNAKVRLLGSELVNLAYDDVTDKLRHWATLQIAASPRRVKIGDEEVELIQAPDPSNKYKAPAQEAHRALQDAIQVLRGRMQGDLDHLANL